jgi:hypothetical protein
MQNLLIPVFLDQEMNLCSSCQPVWPPWQPERLDADLLAPPWGGRGQNFVLHSLGTSSNLPNPIASSYLSADKIIEKIRIGAQNLFIYF